MQQLIYNNSILKFILRLFVLLFFYFLLRVYFYLVNIEIFKYMDIKNIFLAFVHGVRFDLNISLYLLLINFIIIFINQNIFYLKKTILKAEFFFFYFINICFFFINLADAHYFPLTGKRSNLFVLKMKQDISNQIIQLLFNYWFIIIIGVFLSYIFYHLIKYINNLNKSIYFINKIKLYNHTKLNKILYLILYCILLFGIFLGIRGGTQSRPINLSHSYILDSNNLANLVLNTTFSIFQTENKELIKTINFYKTDAEALQVLKNERFKHSNFANNKVNIIILIVESMGYEYISGDHKYKIMPFLSKLSDQSLFFTESYANGRTSMAALPSILLAIPNLLPYDFITSNYKMNKVYGIGSAVKSLNYKTLFLHGGHNGTMSFDAVSKMAGFDTYYGMNEYPNKKQDYDGTWGIFDEDFLQFSVDIINQTNKPFLAGIFTLSSHNPYTVPNKYKNKFFKGDSPIYEALAYTDYAIEQFFIKAKKQTWYNNTLFIITGDHTSSSKHKSEFTTDTGIYRVPIMFYQEGVIKPTQSKKIVQHIDIPLSIIDYIGENPQKYNFNYFGNSVFSSSQGCAYNFPGWAYWIKCDSYFEKIPPDDIINPKNNYNNINEPTKKLLTLLQIYNNGLINNSW